MHPNLSYKIKYYPLVVHPKVVIGLIGSQLDHAPRDRWSRWRPTVDICRHEDFLVDRLELIHSRKATALATTVRGDIEAVSPETTVRTHVLDFDDPWDLQEVYGKLYDFAGQYEFRPDDEDYLVHITTGTHVAQICLFLLTETRHIPGRLLQASPPNKRTPGSVGSMHIVDLDLSRYDQLASRFRREQADGLSSLKAGIHTRNNHFNTLIEQIEKVAVSSRSPLLLTGPTGAGKTLLARRIFEVKRQRKQVEGKFVEVNCATLRGDSAMSALFGHRKGAFTGAMSDRAGVLRSADRGVLFLDEIGELGLDEQAMLLRAIEDKRFLPVGSDREVESDFQLIAGTNRDLTQAVHERRFREDLLARIDVWTFRLPALRQRTEDIEPNLDYELQRWAERRGRQVRLSQEARTRFLKFAESSAAVWSGNFRDFGAAIERMATLCAGGRIDHRVVDDEIERLRARWINQPHVPSDQDHQVLTRHLSASQISELDRFDRVQLAEVLRVCESAPSLSAAGRELFAVSRQQKRSSNDTDRLRKYLDRFGIRHKPSTTTD